MEQARTALFRSKKKTMQTISSRHIPNTTTQAAAQAFLMSKLVKQGNDDRSRCINT
jgi:hypothetical protein